MGNDVFANGREVSCKAGSGKSICAFPDVCFTPPENPATPPGVPVPYPNTGKASDMTSGSKKVKVSKKEVMLKNKSYFKKSMGDEAGCAAKKGAVTSTNRGKVYFNAWSMDVKFEGENVVRHLDLTTHNHMSVPGNTPTWPYLDEMAGGPPGKGCDKERKEVDEKCSGDFDKDCENDDCQKAKKCMLVPHTPLVSEGQTGCCPGDTPHHIVEVHCFTEAGGRSSGSRVSGFEGYNDKRAPCVCVTGSRYKKEHGNMHAVQGMAERNCMDPDGSRSQMGGKDNSWTFGKAKEAGIKAHKATFPDAGPEGNACSEECLAAQLDNYHKQESVGVKDDDTPLRADRSPLKEEQKEWGAEQLSQIESTPGGQSTGGIDA